jgi:CDP-diacylglycerol--glycerol-3-phosphate 3-phosphatidyltransferase
MIKFVPNLLTFSRIAMIPFLVASFYIEGKLWHWVAAGLFAFASITDFFDGYLARAWKAQSKIGIFLDPIADKLLVATVIIMLVHFKMADVVPAILIVCREILVSGLREFLAQVNVSVPVSSLAKVKTGVQMLAIFMLLLGTSGSGVENIDEIGNFALWIASGLTLITGYAYLRAGLKHM